MRTPQLNRNCHWMRRVRQFLAMPPCHASLPCLLAMPPCHASLPCLLAMPPPPLTSSSIFAMTCTLGLKAAGASRSTSSANSCVAEGALAAAAVDTRHLACISTKGQDGPRSGSWHQQCRIACRSMQASHAVGHLHRACSEGQAEQRMLQGLPPGADAYAAACEHH